MSSKPSTVPTWNTGGSNRVAPTSGQRVSGWNLNDVPTSGVFNNEANLYGQWFQWLSDGDVALHNVTAATLELTAGLTVDVDAIIAGAITIGGQLYSFTDFTFTVADLTANTFTATAHPMLTGAGPARVSNSGGGLPAGLTAGTDYWAINIDANTFKLATSQANAVNGVAVDVTTNGTGTQTLQHQAGTTRISDATVTRSLAVAYNATVGGTMAVTGATTVGGTLGVTGTATIGGDEVLGGALTVGGQLYTFADFTFTADSSTDTCTATAHPLHTGAGPIRVSNSGGGLPAGLAAATDYYAINTGTNTFKLATSRANAIALAVIDILSNGTGTQTLQHQSGTTRITDAEVTRNLSIDGQVLTPITLALNQSVTVSGTGDYKHGTRTLQLHGSTFQPISAGVTYNAGASTSGIAGASLQAVSSIPLRDGERILAVRISIADSATGPTKLQASIGSSTSAGVITTIAPSAVSAGTGAFQTLTIASLTITIVSGTSYWLNLFTTTGTAIVQCIMVEIDYDHP